VESARPDHAVGHVALRGGNRLVASTRAVQGCLRRRRRARAFFNEFWSTFQYAHIETYDVAEAGSEVVVPNTAHMRGRDGIEVAARSTFLFTVEDGQITRLRMFQERAEALEAVGLRE
jgi:ketosteroid isomerase-like protein